jgi:isoquinoline 1-oxidoreductase subunit beta
MKKILTLLTNSEEKKGSSLTNTAMSNLGIDNGSTSAEINRRDFLKLSSLASAGLMLSIGLLDSKIAKASPDAPATFEPSVFLRIGSDGKITILSKNPEIGQGIKTSLPQIIAEELEVDWTQIEVQQAPLDNRFGAQFAGGSTGIKTNFDTLRKAGAAAREMLVEAASRKWNISLDQCYAEKGFVYRKDSGAKLTYAELAERASQLNVRENPVLKPFKEFKIIGREIPGVDNLKIVTGKAEFGLDAKPKGMLVAVI